MCTVSEPPEYPPAYLPPQPAPPGYPPPGYPPPGYPPPPARAPLGGARIADIVATAFLCIAQLSLSAFGLLWSLFFPMAMDSCSARTCSNDLMTAAFAAAWGGIGAATLLALIGVVLGATRRRVMFVWPLLGTIIVVAASVGGAQLATAAGGL